MKKTIKLLLGKIKRQPTLRFLVALAAVLCSLMLGLLPGLSSAVLGQFPTVSIPTVTSSPRGIYVRAIGDEYDPLNIRSGPSSTYERIGIFTIGQEAKAYGYYEGYVQIEYPQGPDGKGWVLLARVEVIGGTLPMIEPPPTSTPSVTRTIDPTLAAQFIITLQPTRLPTFTEPQPLMIPTFQAETGATAPGGIPLGLVIVVLAGLGLFLTLIAILRRS